MTWPDRINSSARTFEGWGTVEVPDKEKELLPLDIVEKLMPIYMKRGGVIMDSHTGRHVGKIDKWEKRWNPGAQAYGIYLYGHIFDDYRYDTFVWDGIKSGRYQGLSIGGKKFAKEFECVKDTCFNRIVDVEFWEWSIVPSPMNKESWLMDFNNMAKNDRCPRKHKHVSMYRELPHPLEEYKDLPHPINEFRELSPLATRIV